MLHFQDLSQGSFQTDPGNGVYEDPMNLCCVFDTVFNVETPTSSDHKSKCLSSLINNLGLEDTFGLCYSNTNTKCI